MRVFDLHTDTMMDVSNKVGKGETDVLGNATCLTIRQGKSAARSSRFGYRLRWRTELNISRRT